MVFFKINNLLRTNEGDNTHWRIKNGYSLRNWEYLSEAELQDERDSNHKVLGVSINVFKYPVPPNEWMVEYWQNELRTAFECASLLYEEGWPTPIDRFYIMGDKNYPLRLKRRGEEIFIYKPGTTNRSIPYPKRGSTLSMSKIRTLAKGVRNLLAPLHNEKMALRQIPLQWLRFNQGRYYMGHFFSLTRQGPSNYHPKIPSLALKEVHSAPECFDPDGIISHRTDIYALAKLILEFCGVSINPGQPFPDERQVEQYKHQIEKRYNMKKIPQSLSQFLSVALQPDPRHRGFKNIFQAVKSLKA